MCATRLMITRRPIANKLKSLLGEIKAFKLHGTTRSGICRGY